MSEASFVVDKDNLEVRMSRVFDATPERLWEAHTNPEQVVKWWGLGITVEKFDLRVGGVWRFLSKDPQGNPHNFNGVFKQLEEPYKIVRTFEYEPRAGHILLETFTFEEQPDGRTKLFAVTKYDNLQDLEGMVSSGMKEGFVSGFERLASIVEK